MQRKPWFEIHDHPLFPGFLRDLVTDALEAMWNACDIYGPIVPQLDRAIAASGATHVIDLCSGSGGPWPRLVRNRAESSTGPLVLLTDKYPNRRAFRGIQGASVNPICFHPEPVDAMHIPGDLPGFRTMFSTFHHFAPQEARAILSDAFNQRQGIAVFEAAKCDWRAIATVCMVPLLGLGLAPCIRPFCWERIFWTYCLPMIPFTLWLDGVLSCLRSYSQADLSELTDGLASENYVWEIGEKRRGWVTITYLLGYPAAKAEVADEELEMAEMQRPA
jgi:hypothetical protein